METVRVKLNGTVGYRAEFGDPVVYYGPGDAVLVPIDLARAFGLAPITALQQDPVDETPPETLLPADFPFRDTLAGLGILSLDQVPTTEAELVALPKIGKASAAKILEWLEQAAEPVEADEEPEADHEDADDEETEEDSEEDPFGDFEGFEDEEDDEDEEDFED